MFETPGEYQQSGRSRKYCWKPHQKNPEIMNRSQLASWVFNIGEGWKTSNNGGYAKMEAMKLCLSKSKMGDLRCFKQQLTWKSVNLRCANLLFFHVRSLPWLVSIAHCHVFFPAWSISVIFGGRIPPGFSAFAEDLGFLACCNPL